MTNEEIEQKSAELIRHIRTHAGDLVGREKAVESFARTLVVQAYEEAAQEVDKLEHYVGHVLCDEGIGEARLSELAGDIRALKVQLASPV